MRSILSGLQKERPKPPSFAPDGKVGHAINLLLFKFRGKESKVAKERSLLKPTIDLSISCRPFIVLVLIKLLCFPAGVEEL